MELQRTRPNFIKLMFYCSWNLLLSATRRPANISYFIANHQTSFFCHKPGVFHALHAEASPRIFDWGGTDSDWGGQIQVNRNHLPPNSDFSSDFGHFILKTLENLKILANMHEIFFKNRDIWGAMPPELRTRGDTSPASPPVATPMTARPTAYANFYVTASS